MDDSGQSRRALGGGDAPVGVRHHHDWTPDLLDGRPYRASVVVHVQGCLVAGVHGRQVYGVHLSAAQLENGADLVPAAGTVPGSVDEQDSGTIGHGLLLEDGSAYQNDRSHVMGDTV